MASTLSVAESLSAASRDDHEHRHHDHDIDATARILSAKYLERSSGKVGTACSMMVVALVGSWTWERWFKNNNVSQLLSIASHMPLTMHGYVFLGTVDGTEGLGTETAQSGGGPSRR